MPLPFKLDDGFGSEASLGLIILQTDETLENEFRAVLGSLRNPRAIACHHSRIPMQQDVTKDTLAQMKLDLPASAALLSIGKRACSLWLAYFWKKISCLFTFLESRQLMAYI